MSVTREHRRFFLLGVAGMASLALAMTAASASAGPDPNDREAVAEAAEEVATPVPDDGSGGADDQSCNEGKSCMWYHDNFQNGGGYYKHNADGSLANDGWRYFLDDFTWKSAKNRFNDRKFRVRNPINGETRCLDPGENKPDLPVVMGIFNVGPLGDRCGEGGTPVKAKDAS